MLPQANQARKALWNAVNPHTGKRRIDEAFPLDTRAGTVEDEMLIRFVNGSTWQVVGSDNFNSLVGSPPIGLVFSEWALCDPASWAYLMPIIEENGGWAIFNTTPRGKNHAHKSLLSARKNARAFAEVLSADQTGVFRPDQLQSIRQKLIDTYGEDYGQSLYDQEYGCSFEAANLGAILGRALAKAEAEGRISDVLGAYDPEGAPIEISSDIGRRDASTWWFWQPCVGGFRIVDYDKDSGLDADEWCDRLQKRLVDRKYKLGRIWLPHDARAKTFGAKHSAIEIFIHRFGQSVMGIVPESNKSDRINAARIVVQRCAFHETNTAKGRDGLSAWSFLYDEERKEFSKEPDHNWASHDGDGFSYGAQIMRERVMPVKKPTAREVIAKAAQHIPTFDELLKLDDERRGRARI
jgi:phage terminase large subunit